MSKQAIKHTSCVDRIWLISKQENPSLDLGELFPGTRIEFAKEYRISDLAKYMINPTPINVRNRLVGCELIRRTSGWQAMKKRVTSLFSRKEKAVPGERELLISNGLPGVSGLSGKGLNDHLNHVHDLLRPFDAVSQTLSSLSKDAIIDVQAVCEDLEGNFSFIQVPEPLENKIQYIINNLSKEIPVQVEKAHLNRGLFEMRAYNFEGYNPDNQHRLIKIVQDGTARLYTLTHDNKVEHIIEDLELITYLQLFEISLKGNLRLKNLIHTYFKGSATPTKILFNQEIKTEYSWTNLPLIYRRMEATGFMGPREKKLIAQILNQQQFGLSFNHISQSGEFKDRLITSIFVMQDLNALEPIKLLAPGLYSTINSRAAISEAGTFYLIDSIRGIRDEHRV